MSESPEARTRRRWINFGEFIAVAALMVSAAGVWVSWKNSADKPDDRPAKGRRAEAVDPADPSRPRRG